MTVETKLKHMALVLIGSCAAGLFVYFKLSDGWHGLLAWLAAVTVAIFIRCVLISIWPVRDP